MALAPSCSQPGVRVPLGVGKRHILIMIFDLGVCDYQKVENGCPSPYELFKIIPTRYYLYTYMSKFTSSSKMYFTFMCPIAA